MTDNGVVLVTGGLGYLGSRLLLDAPARLPGRTIRVLDNLQTRGQRALMNLPEGSRVEFVEGDVLDRGILAVALQGVDTVIHLAALVRTPMSFEHPVWVNQVNHWGTATLVEGCLEFGVRRFVYASTTAVYGPGGPFDEAMSARPLGPYASAKHGGEHAVLAAARGLEPTVLRLGSVFGRAPAMRFDGFVNRLAFLAALGRPVPVFGSGEQRRPVVHVDDAVAVLLDQAVASVPVQIVNVVAQNASVLDVCGAIRTAKPTARVVFTEQDVLNHLSFDADGSRLQAAGWRPRVSLEAGVSDLIGALTVPQAPARSDAS